MFMIPKKTITWIAVVNGRQAHFYTKGPEKRLGDLNHTLTALPVRTTNEARKSLGRVHDRFGPARHIAEPHTEDKEQERHLFAQQVADYLQASLAEKQYDRLIMVAPPKTLGVLRKLLSAPVKGVIALELDKDFIHLSPEQIQKHLEKIVYV